MYGYLDDSFVWYGVCDILVYDCCVLIFDVCGVGLLDVLVDIIGYCIFEFVDDFVVVVDVLLFGECFYLVGYDWGFIYSWELVMMDWLCGCIVLYILILGLCLDYVGYWMCM